MQLRCPVGLTYQRMERYTRMMRYTAGVFGLLSLATFVMSLITNDRVATLPMNTLGWSNAVFGAAIASYWHQRRPAHPVSSSQIMMLLSAVALTGPIAALINTYGIIAESAVLPPSNCTAFNTPPVPFLAQRIFSLPSEHSVFIVVIVLVILVAVATTISLGAWAYHYYLITRQGAAASSSER